MTLSDHERRDTRAQFSGRSSYTYRHIAFDTERPNSGRADASTTKGGGHRDGPKILGTTTYVHTNRATKFCVIIKLGDKKVFQG